MAKILLVTGASSNIGCDFIRKNYEKYDKIIAHYNHNYSRIKELGAICNGRIIAVQADFNNSSSVVSMVDNLCKQEIYPDHILHLAANKIHYEKINKCNLEHIHNDMQCSVYSFFELIFKFIPNMVKNKYGKIVVMLSSCTLGESSKFMMSYTMSKYALFGMVKSLSEELASKGITINAISPQMIETSFLSDLPEMIVEMNRQRGPAGRNLDVSEVVPTIEYFLSDMSNMVTGQNILISGIKNYKG